MSGTALAATIMRSVAKSTPVIDEAELFVVADTVDWDYVSERKPMLSSGERALVEFAFTEAGGWAGSLSHTLGAVDAGLRARLLALITETFGAV